MCKAYLIDSAAREVREVGYTPGGESLRTIVGGWIDVAWGNPAEDVLYVDDDGLFKPQSHFFRFAPRPDDMPLPGNGVIVGREVELEDGNYYTEPPTLPIEAVRKMVSFLSRVEADAWAKKNADVPAVFNETKVFATFGKLFGEMPAAS